MTLGPTRGGFTVTNATQVRAAALEGGDVVWGLVGEVGARQAQRPGRGRAQCEGRQRAQRPQLAWSGCIYESGGDTTDVCGPGASCGRDAALHGCVEEADLQKALSWLMQGVPGPGSLLMEPANTT